MNPKTRKAKLPEYPANGASLQAEQATNAPTHAPTPWMMDGEFLSRYITNGGIRVAQMTGTDPQMQANAAFIVRAVNAHHELLSALKQGEDIISGLEAEADNAGLDLTEVRHWWQNIATPAIDKAEKGE